MKLGFILLDRKTLLLNIAADDLAKLSSELGFILNYRVN